MCCKNKKEAIQGYKIKQSIIFENNRGFALAENPDAPTPFVTWQFTEENGVRDYYWGHYIKNEDAAARDYQSRIVEYQKDYGVSEKQAAKPIAEQIKEAEEQAARDNGNRPVPTDKDERGHR